MKYLVFEHFLDSILIVDRSLRVWYANAAASILLETSQRRLRDGKFLIELVKFSPELFEDVSELWTVKDPTPYRELTYEATGGKSGNVKIFFQADPFTDPDDPSWIIYMRDTTLESRLQKKYRAEISAKEAIINDLQAAQAELAGYSKNLEEKVELRAKELASLNRLQQALVNSLSEGLFVFDSKGICLPIYSKACEDLLETIPAGKPVAEVLKIKPAERENFNNWCHTLFAEMLPFEDLVPLGPQQFSHSDSSKHIFLDFHPMRSSEDTIENVVATVRDETKEHLARLEAEIERAHAKRVVQVIKNRRHFQTFINDTRAIFQKSLEQLEKLAAALATNAAAAHDFSILLRLMHTLKGGAASFELNEVVGEAHRCEELITQMKSGAIDNQNQTLLELKASLYTMKAQIEDFIRENCDLIKIRSGQQDEVTEISKKRLFEFFQKLKLGPNGTNLFQEGIREFFFEPIGDAFVQYSEMLQADAKKLEKQMAPMTAVGGDLAIYHQPYAELFGSLVHVFRNIVDHGIESPDERLRAGKKAEGEVRIEFSRITKYNRPWLKMEIADNGRGIDPKKIAQKLSRHHDPQELATLTDHELIQHVFDEEFTTKEEVTIFSGRGVGLDAVKKAVDALQGTVEIFSEPGKGTRVAIECPLIEEIDDYVKTAAA